MIRFLPNRWWSLRAWKTWAGYVHWRLETYGVFYPDGHFHGRAFRSLLRQWPSYRRWLREFERLRRTSPRILR